MKITPERIDLSKTAIITYVVKEVVKLNSVSTEEAIAGFMTTKTYKLLQSEKSKLYTESPEYVLDMLQSELSGDIVNWLKI